MSNAQIQFILKMIPINKAMDDIFLELNQAINIIYSAKTRLEGAFNYDNDTRIKLAVTYNNFRDTFPDLYGNLNRYVSMQYSFLIFETCLNDKGDELYYLAYICNIKIKRIFIFEQTDSSVIYKERKME
jgi:hypothetical protein